MDEIYLVLRRIYLLMISPLVSKPTLKNWEVSPPILDSYVVLKTQKA